MSDTDGSATGDQVRAAEKRRAAAAAADAAKDSWHDQGDGAPASRDEPPKGRRTKKHDES